MTWEGRSEASGCGGSCRPFSAWAWIVCQQTLLNSKRGSPYTLNPSNRTVVLGLSGYVDSVKTGREAASLSPQLPNGGCHETITVAVT